MGTTWWVIQYLGPRGKPEPWDVERETPHRLYFCGSRRFGRDFAFKEIDGREKWFKTREEAVAFAIGYWQDRVRSDQGVLDHYRQLKEEKDPAPVSALQVLAEHLNQLRRENREEETPIVHGVNCPKEVHLQGSFYEHSVRHDGPFGVGGYTYCGRCHCWLGEEEEE